MRHNLMFRYLISNMLKGPKDQFSILLQTKYFASKTQVKGGNQEGAQKVDKFQIKPPKGTRDYYPHQMAIRRKVIDTIVEVFKQHGAVEIDTPVFELKDVLTGKYGEDSKLIYDLEDQGGEKCSLRYDLTVPFARFMANNTNIQKIKRFHIGKVYRRDQPTITKGRFREFYQCDFDIAGKYDLMIPDAQVLAIMQEILESLQVNDFLVKINHRKILEIMIRQAGCPDAMFKTICSSVDKLDKMDWKEVKAELITKGVSEESANIIGKLTEYRGEPLQLLKQLQSSTLFVKTQTQLKQVLKDMSKLIGYLDAMKRTHKVSFDLSLARGLDYYTGLIYEIVLTDKTTELGSISGGGRYDHLIGMFSQYEIPAVGGSIGIERLFTILEKKLQHTTKENQCQILVCSIGNIPTKDRLSILSDLWCNKIKAQTLYVEKPKNMKVQIEHAFDKGIPMLLILGEEEMAKGVLGLKILYQDRQVSVDLKDLAGSLMPYLLQFRQDFKDGKVDLQKPKKDKK